MATEAEVAAPDAGPEELLHFLREQSPDLAKQSDDTLIRFAGEDDPALLEHPRIRSRYNLALYRAMRPTTPTKEEMAAATMEAPLLGIAATPEQAQQFVQGAMTSFLEAAPASAEDVQRKWPWLPGPLAEGVASLHRVATPFANFVMSPAGMATLGLAGTPAGPAIGLAFAAEAAAKLPEETKATGEALAKMRWDQPETLREAGRHLEDMAQRLLVVSGGAAAGRPLARTLLDRYLGEPLVMEAAQNLEQATLAPATAAEVAKTPPPLPRQPPPLPPEAAPLEPRQMELQAISAEVGHLNEAIGKLSPGQTDPAIQRQLQPLLERKARLEFEIMRRDRELGQLRQPPTAPTEPLTAQDVAEIERRQRELEPKPTEPPVLERLRRERQRVLDELKDYQQPITQEQAELEGHPEYKGQIPWSTEPRAERLRDELQHLNGIISDLEAGRPVQAPVYQIPPEVEAHYRAATEPPAAPAPAAAREEVTPREEKEGQERHEDVVQVTPAGETPAQEAQRLVQPPAAPAPKEPAPAAPAAASAPAAKEALIDRIAEAAKDPELPVVPIDEIKGSDGKWYSARGGLPSGVSFTGERRIGGYAYRSPEGTVIGQKFPTEEAAKQAQASKIELRSQEFKAQLRSMSPERLGEQAKYWLKTEPPAAPVTPAAKPRRTRRLPTPQQITDFRPGIDRVERRGNRTFIIDTEGQRAPVEVQHDALTPETEANLRRLPRERLAEFRAQTEATPWLSPEGKAERLKIFDELMGRTVPPPAPPSGPPPTEAAEPPLPTKAIQDSINKALKAADILRGPVRKSVFEKAYATLTTHAAKLDIPIERPGTYFSADQYRKIANDVALAIGQKWGSHPTEELRAQREEALKGRRGKPPPITPGGQALGIVPPGFHAMQKALEGLKIAANWMKERLIGLPKVTDWQRDLGELQFAKSRSYDNAKRFAKASLKAVPSRLKQDAIGVYIDAGMDEARLRAAAADPGLSEGTRAAYRAALELLPEEKEIARSIREYFDNRLKEAQDAGIVEEGVENYIHRLYPKDTPWKRGVMAEMRTGYLSTAKPPLARRRFFEFDYEAEKAGYAPIKNFIQRVLAYDQSLNNAIANRAFVKAQMGRTMPDGRPAFDVAGIGITLPKGEPTPEVTLIKPQFKPWETEDPKNFRGDYMAYNHPAFRKWKWATQDANGNPILVQGDVLVHPDMIGKVKALLDQSAVRRATLGRVALGLSTTVKHTALDLSGFHPVQVTVHGWEHRTFRILDKIDFAHPTQERLIKAGLVAAPQREFELWSEGLAGSTLTKHIPGIGPRLQEYNRWLFEDYIPRLKMSMALHALERNRARFAKDLARGAMTEEQLYRLTAEQGNAAFGEQNWEMLGHSRTTLDVLRLAMFAPDFFWSRAKFVGQAMTYYGREQYVALGLGAVALWATARLLNKWIDDDYHFEPDNIFSLVHNGRAYTLRTVQGDLLHLLRDRTQFFYSRLNPVFGRTAIEALTHRDHFGRLRDESQQFKDFISQIVPISLRGLTTPEQKVWESFLNAFGITNRRWSALSQIYPLAEEYRRKNKLEPGEFIYDPEQDKYHALKRSLSYGDANEAAAEILRLNRTGTTAGTIAKHFQLWATHPFTGSQREDRKFRESLSGPNRQVFDEARKERLALLKKYLEAARIAREQQRKAVPQTK